jgi:periplasmic protein TonB
MMNATIKPYPSTPKVTKIISGLLHVLVFGLIITWQKGVQNPQIILPKSEIIALQFTKPEIVQPSEPKTVTAKPIQPKINKVKPARINKSNISKPIKQYVKQNIVAKQPNIKPSQNQPSSKIAQTIPKSTKQAAYVPPQFNAAHLSNPAPAYPTLARRRGWQGKVLLNVHICSEGKPKTIIIAKSSGYKILDIAAQKAVASWKFIAAKRGNITLASNVIVPINFKLN